MKDKKATSGLIILISVAVIAAVLCAVRLFGSDNKSSSRFSFKSRSKEYIAVIHIDGVIEEAGYQYNQGWLLKTIKDLKEDSKNTGIMLFVQSPGGTVYHADEAYLALLDYKKTGKKVFAYFGSLAASGGYYIGCAADKIYANRNSLIGSIGVICGVSVDATGLMEKLGIKSKTIHSGRNKNMFNYNEPATEEQIQIMQALSDEAYEQFTSIVSLSRHINLEEVKKLADGRIYSAKQAQTNGLIDEVVSTEAAEALIKAECNNPELVFKNFKYEKPDSLRSILMEGISVIKNPQAAFNPGTSLSYLYTGN